MQKIERQRRLEKLLKRKRGLKRRRWIVRSPERRRHRLKSRPLKHVKPLPPLRRPKKHPKRL
jgi:hypothetical protein